MNFSLKAKLVVALFATLFCILFLEAAVRMMCRRDVDGNVWVRSTHLKPYCVPVRSVEAVLEQYAARPDSALEYDAQLGWTQRPGVDVHNAQGFISSQPEVPLVAASGRLRVAVFGGSFTQGNFQTGWWRVLEEKLRAAGVDAEVLNFGVAGYGMDQTLLRWRLDGAKYCPEIVVFGFCAANARDNVNLVRALQHADSSIPFLKPRFLLDGENLKLIDSPTPPPDAVAGLLARLSEWPLIGDDFFYDPDDFRMTLRRRSRLYAMVEAKVEALTEGRGNAEIYAPEGEPMRLSEGIVDEFAHQVEVAGSRFVVLNLPTAPDLFEFQTRGAFSFESLYRALEKKHEMVPTEGALLDAAGTRPLRGFYHDGHYSKEFNAVIGRVLADAIRRGRETGK